MKAIKVNEFGPISKIEIGFLDKPKAGPGELVIKAHYAALNFPDILLVQGQYQLKPQLPFTLGRDVSGTVADVGEGVTEFKIGDRVCGQLEFGAFSEYVLCPKGQCYKLPDSISLEEGAALGLAHQTAYFALKERARYEAGETVLILGAAGSVGLAAVQLVKALGGIAIAGVRNQEQTDIALANGADQVVNLSTENLGTKLSDEIKTATGGKGVDIVIDPVGGSALPAALRCLKWCGRLVVVGFAAGGIPEVRVNYLLLKNIEISGLGWTSYRDFKPELTAKAQEHIYELRVQDRLLPPRIAAIYPFDQCRDALGAIKQGGVNGRILLSLAAD